MQLLRIIPYLAIIHATVECKFFADEVNTVLYDLSISAFPLNADSKTERSSESTSYSSFSGKASAASDYVSIGNKYGQQYHCRLPAYIERANDEGLLDAPLSVSVNNDEIRKALDSLLIKPCLRKTPDWWTYEFCYKSIAMQYHMEGNAKQGDTIYLGRYESEKDWTKPEALMELSGKRKKTLYHSHVYTNGTVCDLTNKFRRTEVRFYCDEDLMPLNQAYLHSVDEPESCQYILTVHVGALCRIPAFLPADRKPTPLSIECQPVLSGQEFDKYMKAKEAEEARKAEDAQRRLKEQEELKKKMDAEKAKYQKPKETLEAAEEENFFESLVGVSSTMSRMKTTTSPLARVLGISKADFLEKKEQSKPDASATTNEDKSATDWDFERLGSEGSVEFEYMMNWLEKELTRLQSRGDIDLKGVEMLGITANDFNRRSRRTTVFVQLAEQAETLVSDLFESITRLFNGDLDKMKASDNVLAREEIKLAMTRALANLLDELDAVERDMELLDEKTDQSGLAAFIEMREMMEERKRLLREFEDSGLNAKDFIRDKISKMPPITDEEMNQMPGIDSASTDAKAEEASRTASKSTSESISTASPAVSTTMDVQTPATSTKSSRLRNKMEDWLKGTSSAKTTTDSKQKHSAETDDHGRQTKESVVSEKSAEPHSRTKNLQREMESELEKIMGDVEKELNEGGSFNELNQDEIAEVKAEAFKSLAKTLTNLLDKLDVLKKNEETETEKQLKVWRKLMEELDEEEETSERKPLGSIQVKSTDDQTKSTDGVKVRVSTIKKKDADDDSNEEQNPEAAKLERRIADKLKEAGFDTQGRALQVKIITNLNLDENAEGVHTLNDEESDQVTNVIMSLFGGPGQYQTAEQRRLQSMEASYNFGVDDSGESESKDKKSGQMNTVVYGGGP